MRVKIWQRSTRPLILPALPWQRRTTRSFRGGPAAAVELERSGLKGLLSPTLSSAGGEGEDPGRSPEGILNSMAVGGLTGAAKNQPLREMPSCALNQMSSNDSARLVSI